MGVDRWIRGSCGIRGSCRAAMLLLLAHLAAAAPVRLNPQEVVRMGIVTAPAAAVSRAAEVRGFGVVVAHEIVAQAVADWVTAAATERQSRSALERIQRLSGTPGAMPADALEAALRQATVDRAALALARRRLSAAFGQHPPWGHDGDSPRLAAVASGEIKLVRVTFPLGALSDPPTALRLTRIDARGGDAQVGNAQAGNAQRWTASEVWRAPADASLPGLSVFALLEGDAVAEGERLLAWTSLGAPEPGVLIPAAAIVISAGKYWCFVESSPGVFDRTPVATDVPVEDGYVVRAGVKPGAKVVVASAGTLLAREINPSTAAQ